MVLPWPSLAHAQPPIASVRIDQQDDASELTVSGRFEAPTFVVHSSKDRRSATLEIQGVSLPAKPITVLKSGEAKNSLLQNPQLSQGKHGVRLTMALSRPCTYRARTAFGTLALRFEPYVEQASKPPGKPPAPATTAVDGTASPRAQVRRPPTLRAELRDGAVRLSVAAGQEVSFRVHKLADRRKRLEIDGLQWGSAGMPRRLESPSKALVRSIELRQEGTRTIVEVEHGKDASDVSLRQSGEIVWLFSEGRRRAERPATLTVAREAGEEPAQRIDSDEAAGFVSGVPLQIAGSDGDKPRKFNGRRIDLDFKDADIHNILRLLAEVGGVNVVTSDDVGGTVTIRMRNAPWDEALEVILQSKGLGMVQRGNLIRVAPLETLEKEREAALARRKLQEQLAAIETRLVPVSYATAQELSPRVKELLSGRGSVSVDERTNVLVVRDVIQNLDDVEELVRSLDAQTPQVLIEARIIEASSQYARDIGIQWGGDAVWSTANGNPTGLNFPSNVGVAGGNYDANSPTQGLNPYSPTVSPPNYAVNLPAITGTGQGGALGMTFGSLNGNFNLSVRLSAAESSGTVRIISSPRVLTLDNHEAHISQGTLIPYSQVSAQGVQTAFQEAKLELRVRPHVTSDGSITMQVKITRAEPDFTRTGPRGDPTIRKREAETNLLVNDGDTAVIGGIYTRNSGRNKNQVPFFGDIPVLGILFQRRRVTDDRTEMLIFLTPRIVNREEALRL